MTLTFRGAASLGRAIGQDPRQPRQGQDSVLPKAGADYPLRPQAVPSSKNMAISQELPGQRCLTRNSCTA